MEEREEFYPVLESSFEGWYLAHSKRTLRDIDKVFGAKLGDKNVGVVMLKFVDPKVGYVYYIAVDSKYRGMKIGSRLLDYSLSYFSDLQSDIVLASLTTEHGDESKYLFLSKGFKVTNFGEISKRFGRLRAINLYRKMLVVSGETVVIKELLTTLM
ncbi:MAG: GNAT family N-acetyltransferase [Thaumarchaeota archaeon]|nr:GNAT family N-acetyltransferase [Nitrososphaerota archaeon]